MALNLRSFCLNLPRTGIIGVYHLITKLLEYKQSFGPRSGGRGGALRKEVGQTMYKHVSKCKNDKIKKKRKKVIWIHLYGTIFYFYILFHLPVCLSLVQNHTVLIIDT
jgi:hypothetical protein